MKSHTLDYLLRPFQPFLEDPNVEEICMNRPDGVWVWAKGKFKFHVLNLEPVDVENIAIVAAAQRRQNVGADQPLLATDLDGAGRLQVVLPPCVEAGCPSLTIRCGTKFNPTIDELALAGLFAQTKGRRRDRDPIDQKLIDLHHANDWKAFFEEAVRAKKTIVACGVTASGKTTFAKALIGSIPRDERLITIEDTPEWTDIPHENRVALYYDKDGKVRAGDLVEAALRMRIGRLLVQEIRDGTSANAFLQALQSGHPGGITTIHAPDGAATFDRLRSMIKQTPAGAALSDADLIGQLHSLIDIVVHCQRPPGEAFSISEVWFAPVSLAQTAAV